MTAIMGQKIRNRTVWKSRPIMGRGASRCPADLAVAGRMAADCRGQGQFINGVGIMRVQGLVCRFGPVHAWIEGVGLHRPAVPDIRAAMQRMDAIYFGGRETFTGRNRRQTREQDRSDGAAQDYQMRFSLVHRLGLPARRHQHNVMPLFIAPPCGSRDVFLRQNDKDLIATFRRR